MFAAQQGQPGGSPDIKSAIAVLRQRLGNPYGKARPPLPGQGAGPQGINPSAVTTQGGQQGIVGRGGNFQPLGEAASRRLGQSGAISNSGEIQGNGAASTSGPIMATKPAPMPPGGLGGMTGPDGSSGRKPWQVAMPSNFNVDAMKQSFERMSPEQQQAAMISIAGFPAPPNQTADPAGGRGFVPPQGAESGNVSMERGLPFGGGMTPGGVGADPAGGRGFVPPDAAATAMQGAAGGGATGAPGMPPQLLQQLQQLRGGGQASPFRSLVAGALGNQMSY